MSEDTKTTDELENSVADEQNQSIQGQSIFLIETVAAGVAVQTGFLATDGAVHMMPAVFPSLQYALQQIDELRGHVINHFENAAQVGLKVIAENVSNNESSDAEQNQTLDEK